MKKEQTTHDKGQSRAGLQLFYGDEFLVKEQVSRVVADFLSVEERATNFVVLDGANLDTAALAVHLSTPSLFGGRRVVLVEQTPLFVGKVDRDKLVDKAVGAWKANDRKAAHRVFGQLIGMGGVSVEDLTSGQDWVGEIYPDPAAPRELETLLIIARSFLDSGERVGSAGDEAAVEELIERALDDDVALIFTAPAVDKRKKLFKIVEKRGVVVECSVREEKFGGGMDRGFFEERVRQELSRAGKTIARDALDTVYARAGKEMRRLHSEMEKLIGYVGERAHITNADVQAVFTDFHEAAFYEINRAVRSGDIAKCLPALRENLKIVVHPLQTLGAIANEFRRLMAARELLFTVFRPRWKPTMTYQQYVPVAKQVRDEHPELLSKGKFSLLAVMKDYPLYLTLKDAQRFDMERLTAIMEAILDADILLKSTRIGGTAPEIIMERLIMKICDATAARRGRIGRAP
jgi:DNA polymerase-3 subunit delta